MPTDYVQIREENIGRYGSETAHLALLGDLYSERTHCIFELLQNAEDAKASAVQFRIVSGGLEVGHNGRPFNSADVRGISSICQSTSRGDPERIGRFGIGFKSVYAYTRAPEIHSGDEHFCIEHYVRPKEAKPRAPDASFTTLIALPFDASAVSPAVAKREIFRTFQRLDPTTLMFLRNVKRVELCPEQGPAVVVERRRTDLLSPWVRLVELGGSTNGDVQDKWLLFERPIKLTTPAGNEVQSRVEIACRLTPSSCKEAFEIVACERAVLAVFFPTDLKTATGFILQGPYVPTPARDNIRQNDPTNNLLAEESAKLIVDSLCWLRDRGALTPSVLNTLPLKRSHFPEDTLFHPLFHSVLAAIVAQALLPAHTADSKEQVFVEGSNAVAASSPALRDLLGDSLLSELVGVQSCKWLTDELTVKGSSDLATYLRDEVDVREISAHDFVVWLGTKNSSWWKEIDEEWLLRCYRYLHTQPAEHAALEKLPIARLESGEHVVPADQPVFFPAENANEKEELAPFLCQLPIVRQALVSGHKDKTVGSFLRQMGVAPLVAFQFIQKYLVPRYTNPKNITVGENRSHVRFLKRAFSRISVEERRAAISEIQKLPILICHKVSDPEPNCLVSPVNAYLPIVYTNDGKLELFFQTSPGTWFVDSGYISVDEDPKEWALFLITLGVERLPRVITSKEREGEDRKIDGLKAVLNALSNTPPEKCAVVASAVWLLTSRILPDGGEYDNCVWDQFVSGHHEIYGPRGGHWGQRRIDANFFISLRDTAWLPDTAGKSHSPGQLFEDTTSNRELLGEVVTYLHRGISLLTRKEEWLAAKLGIRRSPTKESVMLRLRSLRSATATINQAAPLYEFLNRTRAHVSDAFEGESLIFCPGRETRWLSPSQSFWEDESAVFGTTRAYLKKLYPALQEFFIRIGVSVSAGPPDYARGLLEIAAAGLTQEAIPNRVHCICKRLADRLEEGGDWQKGVDWQAIWQRLLQGDHWLARCGDKHTFKALKQIVRMDNEHLAELFEAKLSFWPFPDLNDFAAQQLSVLGCSSATCRFTPVRPAGVNARLTLQLNNQWWIILAFLHSDKWKSDVRENVDIAITRNLVVNLAAQIAVRYDLGGVSVEEPEGKSSFFDGESGTLWLKEGLDVDDMVEGMGEALQEFFGPEVLREFVCDLFRKGTAKALEKWRKKGLILTAPIESSNGGAKPPPSDDSEPVEPEVEQAEHAAGQIDPAKSAVAGSTRDPEPSSHRSSGGRDGEPSSATGNETGETTLYGGGQPPRKADDKIRPATSAAGSQGKETSVKGAEMESGNAAGANEIAPAGACDAGQVLNGVFNKSGKTQITDERPQSGEVRNPADRRGRTRDNYRDRKSREPAVALRTTPRTVDIWDPKNKAVRDFLYEEYSGKCQICGEMNRFPRRDGKAYFEAVYLIPHSGAAWTDEPGSVLCLCALCSAKFQHGTVECPDILQQIESQKTVEEGGKGRPSISIKLIGKSVVINFSESHLIEVQELLGVAAVGSDLSVRSRDSSENSPAGLSSQTAPVVPPKSEVPKEGLVRCPQCHPNAGLIRRDRLERHIAKSHQPPDVRGLSLHVRTKNSSKYSPAPQPIKEVSGLRRCQACGCPAVPGDDYCYYHM